MDNELKIDIDIEKEKDKVKEYLPIGTVVRLKNGKKDIMITSYCIMPTGDVYDKDGKVEINGIKVFDYGATFYPEGYVASNRILAFDHEQIEEIRFMGYETQEQKDMTKKLAEKVEKTILKTKEYMEEQLKQKEMLNRLTGQEGQE